MGKLYRDDINKYKSWFKEASELLGIDVEYRYIMKRNTEYSTGESVYSELSEPITKSVIIESGLPMINSLKQLGWFTNSTDINEELLVDFPVDTPNLQEGCRFLMKSNETEQKREYTIIRLSSSQLYPSCIKCLCIPILKDESTIVENNVHYGQQSITSDEENYTFINEKPKLSMF